MEAAEAEVVDEEVAAPAAVAELKQKKRLSISEEFISSSLPPQLNGYSNCKRRRREGYRYPQFQVSLSP